MERVEGRCVFSVNAVRVLSEIVCERQDNPIRGHAEIAEAAEGGRGGDELFGAADAQGADDTIHAHGGRRMWAAEASELPPGPAFRSDGDEGFVIVVGEGGADDLLIGAWVECSIHIRSFHVIPPGVCPSEFRTPTAQTLWLRWRPIVLRWRPTGASLTTGSGDCSARWRNVTRVRLHPVAGRLPSFASNSAPATAGTSVPA
jgi:hypothetical protein